MISCHCLHINCENPDKVCIAINELINAYKNIRIITIIKEGYNHLVFYELGVSK